MCCSLQNMYGRGVRKMGVTTLPPMGCLPAAITLFGSGSNQCVARLNQDAISFNNKLNITAQAMQDRLSGLNLVVFDIYQPLSDMITKPTDNGNSLLLYRKGREREKKRKKKGKFHSDVHFKIFPLSN